MDPRQNVVLQDVSTAPALGEPGQHSLAPGRALPREQFPPPARSRFPWVQRDGQEESSFSYLSLTLTPYYSLHELPRLDGCNILWFSPQKGLSFPHSPAACAASLWAGLGQPVPLLQL